MSHVAIFTHGGAVYSKSRERVTSGLSQNRKVIMFLLILLIALFFVLYIVQANSVATGGYKIREHNNKAKILRTENKDLELKLSGVRSLGFLEERLETLNMVKIGEVEYLLPISQVAAR